MQTSDLDAVGTAGTGGGLSRRAALRRLGQGGAAVGVAAGMSGLGLAAGLAADGDESASCCPDCACEGAEPAEVVLLGSTVEDLSESTAEGIGRLRRVTDYDRGAWLDTGDGWLSLRGEVFDVRAYGATGDGVTDDWDAFQSAIEAMTTRLDADSTSAYGRTLYVPPGTYRLAQTLVLNRSVRLVGAGAAGRFTDSVLLLDPGIVGVVIAAAEPGLTGQPGRRGDGAIVERLRIETAGTSDDLAVEGDATPAAERTPVEVEPDRTAIHGVWLRAAGSVRDCRIAGFGGDGIHVDLGTADDAGRDPVWEVAHCQVERCGNHGLAARGMGSGVCRQLSAIGNAKWGIQDDGTGGNAYVGCYVAGNGTGAYTSSGAGARVLFAGCSAAPDQPRSVFGEATLIVGGNHGAGFEGGNAWTTTGARMRLLAQEPGSGETRLPTAPTLYLEGARGQTSPHLFVTDREGGRQVEIDPSGRTFLGPVGPADAVGTPTDGAPVQLSISHPESGQAAIRWAIGGETPAWIAQARAFRETAGPDAPNAIAGSRLTFQVANADGAELDVLTVRPGGVGVGTVAPAPTAALEVNATAQGFLPPRLTAEQRDQIVSPAEGLLIYNTTSNRLNFHDGERWQEVAIPIVGG